MKASIFLRIYNKGNDLPNVIHSIARQDPPFDWDVCAAMDGPQEEAEELLVSLLPNINISRYERSLSMKMNSRCLDVVSPDSDIIIIQSSDVIHCDMDTIEQLCKGVVKRRVCSAEVKEIRTDPNLYKSFESNMNELLKDQWEDAKVKAGYVANKERRKYFPFLMAIRREDFEYLGLRGSIWCDNIITSRLMRMGFESYFPGVKGIHQEHDRYMHACPTMLTECGTRIRPYVYGSCRVASYFKSIGIDTEEKLQQYIKEGAKPICIKKV